MATATPGADWLQRFLEAEALPAATHADFSGPYAALADRLLAIATPGAPPLIGLNGAQGSGKSTLARFLVAAAAARGRRVLLLSLDDFYLEGAQRERLAQEIHPLLATRGVPGTHDCALLDATITRAQALADDETLEWPRFDKARDDRDARPHRLRGPVDAIVLEGWCVGQPPQDEHELMRVTNSLERDEDPDGAWRRYVNRRLADDYRALFARLTALWFLAVPNFAAAARWRADQEATLRARHAGGMTPAELARFMQYFERLTRAALATLPASADAVLWLDDAHRCRRLDWRAGG